MSDTTLIGAGAASAVVLVLLLLVLRRRPGSSTSPSESTAAQSTSTSAPQNTTEADASKNLRDVPESQDSVSRDQPEDAAGARDERLPSRESETGTPAGAPPAADDLPPTPDSEDAASSQHPLPERTDDESLGAFQRGLRSTRSGFVARLAALFRGSPTVDEALFEQVEEALLTADLGVHTTERILESLRERARSGLIKSQDDLWSAVRCAVEDILDVPTPPLSLDGHPSVVLIAGVNGVGKTTTIGKLASKYAGEGRRVLLAAGDTYRAAAVLQLEVWGQRVSCPVVKGKDGADPGSVIFDAVSRAREEGYDLVIADTAGRLHTKQPLMEELKKVDRTVTKALGGRGADEIFLVLDATTGQNAVQQMHMFREALAISGVVLTKLDGTAKGGVVLGIVDEHKVPVRFVGLGERVEDLREFSAKSFVSALFEQDTEQGSVDLQSA